MTTETTADTSAIDDPQTAAVETAYKWYAALAAAPEDADRRESDLQCAYDLFSAITWEDTERGIDHGIACDMLDLLDVPLTDGEKRHLIGILTNY